MSHYLPGINTLWAETLGHPDIRVAILDGPVDTGHPCFRGTRLQESATLVPDTARAGPGRCHGTHIASLILGQHGTPVAGIAPGITGLILPVFSDGPEGSLRLCSQLDLARAITLAVESDAHVISISAGQLTSDGSAEDYLQKAVQLCADRNVLIVAAAGNDGCDCLHIPAAIPSVLAVGAMDENGEPLGISNWGSAYRKQGVLAPGVELTGASPGGGVVQLSGTSVATAVVSGVAALLLSLQRKRREAPSPFEVRSAILAGARPCSIGRDSDCRRILTGRLDVVEAMKKLEGVSPQQGDVRGEPAVRLSALASLAAAKPAASDELNRTSLGESYVQSQLMDPSQSTASAAAGPPLDFAITESPGGIAPLAASPTAVHEPPAPGVALSACGCSGTCGGAPAKPALVYALGSLTHDFAGEARRDSLVQNGLRDPHNPAALVEFLKGKPESSSAVTWVLNQESTPIYAIRPAGAFAAQGYRQLVAMLEAQIREGVEVVSVPGYIMGTIALMSGQTVPVIAPELRGMFSWAKAELLKSVVPAAQSDSAEDRAAYTQRLADVGNFLDRVYFEIRNLGVSSQDRAMNYAATNAFQVEKVFEAAIKGETKLDSIDVERSPICRPGADCWDVKLAFFNPKKRSEEARVVYRFTVDVSDVIPVSVGKLRHWYVY
jgi:cyanobactin maturation PatA/PatG family protease